jgi:hypothetical protein
MRLNLPTPPMGYDREYFRYSFSTIERAQLLNVVRNEAVESILLQASNGSVWKVTVSDTGTLQTTSVPLGQTGAPTY